MEVGGQTTWRGEVVPFMDKICECQKSDVIALVLCGVCPAVSDARLCDVYQLK